VDARALSAHGSIADSSRNDRRESVMPEIVLRNQRNFIQGMSSYPLIFLPASSHTAAVCLKYE
jgi:hypothetical protein